MIASTKRSIDTVRKTILQHQGGPHVFSISAQILVSAVLIIANRCKIKVVLPYVLSNGSLDPFFHVKTLSEQRGLRLGPIFERVDHDNS